MDLNEDHGPRTFREMQNGETIISGEFNEKNEKDGWVVEVKQGISLSLVRYQMNKRKEERFKVSLRGVL